MVQHSESPPVNLIAGRIQANSDMADIVFIVVCGIESYCAQSKRLRAPTLPSLRHFEKTLWYVFMHKTNRGEKVSHTWLPNTHSLHSAYFMQTRAALLSRDKSIIM